jgi:Zn-dependent M16 (insulinase) family peptidase
MTKANAAAVQQNPSLSPDSVHPAFQRIRSEAISSLNIVMEEYHHKVTGAVHYHLCSENTENVFLVALRTVPMDSTGVAHILEHTALCGSKNYPVRDPFFMMIRRSLNTFMNAFTSSDWTAYPFASKNKKDFNNLLKVYLDAVFFSRLHELDFAQEGHRFEFSEMENPESELQYKGVVYNEMKGAMSSTNAVLWQTISKYLFPTTTYHYNSGGEPDHIPDLSYNELKTFYKSHYHPSNSVFMTFGDIPASAHHRNFEELALAQFSRLDINIAVANEKRYLSPVKMEENYASDDAEGNKTHVAMGWLFGTSTNLRDTLKAQLLSSVLLDNSASPLLQVLETSKLGSSPSPLCGLEDSNREMSFMAGLEGCAEDSTHDVEKLIIEALENIASNGVDQKQVDAALHQLELSQREISGDGYPYGLQLILQGLSTAVHRGDPIKLLNIDPVLDELREQIKDPQFVPQLVRELILENPHRVTLTLNPDNELAARKAQAEINQLAHIKAGLSTQQTSEIIEQGKALEQRQQQEDDPGLLPKVGLEDVPAQLEEVTGQHQLLGKGQNLTFYDQGTNGLCYQQVIMDLPQLSPDLLSVLPLYTTCVSELGIGELDYTAVQTWQAQISGGLNCFSSIRSNMDDVQKIRSVLAFSSKALTNNHSKLTELVARTINECRFDEGRRVHELIEQLSARRENSITGQGHSLAMALASSKMSPTAQLGHQFGGLEGIKSLKALSKKLDDKEAISELLSQFKELHNLIIQSPKQFLLIAEGEHQAGLVNDLEQYWGEITTSKIDSRLELPPVRSTIKQAWLTSTQVSFCAKAYATVSSTHEDNAVLHVLAGFLRNGFLHRAIREQGGAYGGGAGQDAGSASFRFFSYRDPRLDETMSDFDRAIDWVSANDHQPHQLEEAILGVIAAMDKPSSPAGEAKQAFYNRLYGRTLEQRMEFRHRALDVSMDDLKGVAQRYFDPDSASVGVITNPECMQKSILSDLEEVIL